MVTTPTGRLVLGRQGDDRDRLLRPDRTLVQHRQQAPRDGRLGTPHLDVVPEVLGTETPA